jgi:hypothetical protein
MEELHRRLEMSGLISARRLWVVEQTYQLAKWQVSGGSKVERAVLAGEAFDIASGIRQLGVQRVPVASVAPTLALSTLTVDDDFLNSFADRESRSEQRKLEKVPLLSTMNREANVRDKPLLLGDGSPRVIGSLLDEKPPSSLQFVPVDSEDVIVQMDLGGNTTAELAIKGTALENMLSSSVAASEIGDNISIEWRQDMERYRWRQMSDGGKVPPAGIVVPTPESFQPESYKPTRFRLRSKLRAMAWITVSSIKAATTSKLASYIQVQK